MYLFILRINHILAVMNSTHASLSAQPNEKQTVPVAPALSFPFKAGSFRRSCLWSRPIISFVLVHCARQRGQCPLHHRGDTAIQFQTGHGTRAAHPEASSPLPTCPGVGFAQMRTGSRLQGQLHPQDSKFLTISLWLWRHPLQRHPATQLGEGPATQEGPFSEGPGWPR